MQILDIIGRSGGWVSVTVSGPRVIDWGSVGLRVL